MKNFETQNKITWAYEIEGEGPVVLFIHGWGVDRRIWRQQTKYFCESRKVISVDLPGHGDTPWKEVTLEQLAYDVKEILNAEKAESVDVIGSSLGGLVSLKLCEIAPEKVRSLAMVGSLPRFAKSDEYPYGIDVERMLKVYHHVHWKFPDVLKAFFRSMFTDTEKKTRRFKWLERFRRDEGAPNQWAIKEYLTLIFNEDLRETLRRLILPVCFVYGTGDPICGPDSMAHMREIIPSAHFVAFEDHGHFPFLMAVEDFNEALEKFWAGK